MQRFLLVTTFVIGGLALAFWLTSWALQPSGVGPAVAPEPSAHPEALVQVYGADVWGIRGRFAIHTWVATKARGADDYSIYQVIGWRLRRGKPVVSMSAGNPAQPWFCSEPVLLHEVRGTAAQPLVAAIEQAANDYPYPDQYVMYPGPNSNSFTAWIGLQVPQLGLELPAKAIGKNWMIEEYPKLP